jgi:hypothetical protein
MAFCCGVSSKSRRRAQRARPLPHSSPGSSNALLDGAKDLFPQAGRNTQWNEEAPRKEIVLTRFVDDSELSKIFGVLVAKDAIDLSPFERDFVASVLNAERERPGPAGGRAINRDSV